MSLDLGELLRDAAPEPSQRLDVLGLVQQAQHRRRRARVLASAAVACAAFLGVAGLVLNVPDVTFEPTAPAQGGTQQSPATGGLVGLPPVDAVAASWVNGEPVWVRNDGATVLVLDAVNPHEWYGLDELVGWCQASGSFEAWWDWSLFDESGRYIAGPAPTDLPRYAVDARVDGRVRLGDVVTPGRSPASDEFAAPWCREEGGDPRGGTPAQYHPPEGSNRQVFEGTIMEGEDGVARFCPTDGGCQAGSLTVPEAEGLDDEVIVATLLARSDGEALRDVLLLPPDYGISPSPVESGGSAGSATLVAVDPYPSGGEPFTVPRLPPGYEFFNREHDDQGPELWDLRFHRAAADDRKTMILIRSMAGAVPTLDDMVASGSPAQNSWESVDVGGKAAVIGRGDHDDVVYWVERDGLSFSVLVRHLGAAPLTTDSLVAIAEAVKVNTGGTDR